MHVYFQTPHAVKLVYTLTKPVDVTRRRVLELLDYARKREAKKVIFKTPLNWSIYFVPTV